MNYCKKEGGAIASIHSDKENAVVMTLANTVAYIGAESDGQGNWKWNDGSRWWQPAPEKHDGIQGITETRIAVDTDNKWHDWATGGETLGVICAILPDATTTGTCQRLCFICRMYCLECLRLAFVWDLAATRGVRFLNVCVLATSPPRPPSPPSRKPPSPPSPRPPRSDRQRPSGRKLHRRRLQSQRPVSRGPDCDRLQRRGCGRQL